MGVKALNMAAVPPLSTTVKTPNKCSYSAPSDSDSEPEDEWPEDTLMPAEANRHNHLKMNNWNKYNPQPHGSHSNLNANPGVLLHMISDDRDLWSVETQEMKRQTWMKAQQDHQSKMEKHMAQIEQQTQQMLKQYKEKVERDAEHVRKVLEKLELDRKKEEERIDQDHQNKNAMMRQMIERSIKEEKERQEQARKDEEKKQEQEAEDRKRREEQQQRDASLAQADKEKKEREAQELSLKKEKAAQAALMQKSQTLSVQGVEESKRYFELLKKFKEEIKPTVANNSQWKQGATKSRMKLKRMMGQLINKRETILRITSDTHTIFNDCRQVSDILYEWIMNFAAKAIVHQAETEVTVKPSTAYPLAHVSVMLASKHPGFMDLLIARIVKHCPYIIPRYYDDDPKRNPDETRRLMGYKYTDKEAKTWEDSVQYKEHMSGLISLWGAIVQTVPEPGVGENPYCIRHGWTWLARICNIPPRAITPALLNAFLEIAGERMLATYPRQLPKVLQLIMQQYLPLLSGEKDAVAAASRLTSYLETFATSGKLGSIEGSKY